jgi:hypothetical protein
MPNVTAHTGIFTRHTSGYKGVIQQLGSVVFKTRFLSVLILIATLGCISRTRPVPGGSVAAPVTQPSTAADSGSDMRLTSSFHPGRVVYDLTVSSVIESLVGDSVPRVDSIRLSSVVSAEFTINAREPQIEASVQADSTRLFVTPNQAIQLGTFRQKYAIDHSGRVHRIPSTPQPCGMEADNPVTGEEILPRLPSTASFPESWSDTTLYELCRGGVLLQATRIATYRRFALPDSSTSTSQLIRYSHLTLTGRGSQWDQPVEATGSGDSVDTLTLSHTQLRLTRVVGSARLEVKFLSRYRNQVLRQFSQSQLRLRP